MMLEEPQYEGQDGGRKKPSLLVALISSRLPSTATPMTSPELTAIDYYSFTSPRSAPGARAFDVEQVGGRADR